MARIDGSASAEIAAPLERVWTEITDVLAAPDWQGGMDSMEALEHDADGRVELAETKTNAGVTTIASTVRFDYDGPTRLSWRQERGTLKAVEGSWTLTAIDGERTRATYALAVDTGTKIGLLVRGPVLDKLRAMLLDARPEELKRRIEEHGG